jgi:CHAD domain-containing protein
MAYRLKAGRPLAKSIRRAGLDQIERAASELARNPNPHEGVHQARKAFKRMRALLVLIRPIIGEKAYAREDRRYSRLGRRFSGARDIQAMLETVRKLEIRYALSGKSGASRKKGGGAACAVIGDWLRHERSLAEKNLSGERHVGDGLEALMKAERRFNALPLDAAELQGVVQGLKDGYRAGRHGFAKAYATREDEDFHDWRKAMQRHWRHLQLVASAWPEALQPRIDLAQELSQLLGDDHDLSVLREKVAANRAVFASELDDAQVDEFVRLCCKRQAELRRLAKARGARLFGEKPRAFGVRIANYWRTASQISRLTNMSVDTDQGPDQGDGSDAAGRRPGGGKVVPLRQQ